ncbi:limonoid 21-O-acetyltransferse-like [Nicotiana tabacum]|uniref:Limonoid 21-O-acetyltransferse-like n=1 Tax=Nicotiana tabacum TaxID=4097 RepID=A0AC58TX32_TOBAC
MEMKVEITHKDTIKPSSPTPLSQRDYKLSLIDQLTPGPYVPIVLFYDSTTKFCHDLLKKSLSKTLNYMYPLAGRIKDDFTIECNDKGVDFLEANVSNITLSNIVNDPKIGTLSQLLPCHPHARSKEPSDQVLLAVQVTKFPCGGISIGVCVWHLIADASTLVTLVKTWATMNQENGQESNVIGNGYIVNVTGIFPPRDLSNNPLLTMVPIPEELPFKISMKRFIFDNSKLAALIQSCPICPTRFEALGNEVGIAGCISWCKLPFDEADFGWGKPIWIANPMKFPCGFNLLDTVDGKGIEVWMGLPEEEMQLLEKNKDFLSYVSLSQHV